MTRAKATSTKRMGVAIAGNDISTMNGACRDSLLRPELPFRKDGQNTGSRSITFGMSFPFSPPTPFWSGAPSGAGSCSIDIEPGGPARRCSSIIPAKGGIHCRSSLPDDWVALHVGWISRQEHSMACKGFPGNGIRGVGGDQNAHSSTAGWCPLSLTPPRSQPGS